MTEYNIEPGNSKGVFEVTNVLTNEKYHVDVNIPFCSCLAFKYKKGNNRRCKHILMALGLNQVG